MVRESRYKLRTVSAFYCKKYNDEEHSTVNGDSVYLSRLITFEGLYTRTVVVVVVPEIATNVSFQIFAHAHYS